jgi:choline-sulfatase
MVRLGDWKLVYYEGMEPQLFNLAEDPGEMHDRAADPAAQTVRSELTARALADWSPGAIAQTLAHKRAESAILRQWANKTLPPEQYRWPLLTKMNRLDDWDAGR